LFNIDSGIEVAMIRCGVFRCLPVEGVRFEIVVGVELSLDLDPVADQTFR
jgi:hypothetical protein